MERPRWKFRESRRWSKAVRLSSTLQAAEATRIRPRCTVSLNHTRAYIANVRMRLGCGSVKKRTRDWLDPTLCWRASETQRGPGTRTRICQRRILVVTPDKPSSPSTSRFAKRKSFPAEESSTLTTGASDHDVTEQK
ncbi:hypothetical protein EDB81DRAFT_763276 [Dactylonectria macrodidyma]|uniref:Uncharacterized protein n=1 Tax=Dactylonectria macrodidyma TaxID=307937 RepID=A0A9P9E8V7_9HYPO|nr:hypothetical protein EDB81DRAFT_763276 [Dactylonectria macrodidyma]